MRILVVEDDPLLGDGIKAGLAQAGFAVDWVKDGVAGELALETGTHAAVVLDLGLPRLAGVDVLRRMRADGNKTPVLILTARDAIEDRVSGLDLGADDYLLKPFEPSELEARIRALLRRSQGEASPEISVGTLTIDQTKAIARIGDRELELRRREWAVLERLIARVGKVVSKDRLTAEVFGYDDEVAPNAIEVYVGRLRRKLEPDGPEIRTIRGLGYMLVAN